MTQIRGTKPEQYAGAFQHFDEIPQRYRLDNFAARYRGQDVWDRFTEQFLEQHDSERIRRTLRLSGDSWLEHMHERDRHHALATPEDANEWCEKLRRQKARRTAYEYYFVRVYDFYNYLKSNFQHPHLYNPFLLAAINYDSARYIWMFRIERRTQGSES
jgi:hypothetical protein